MMGLDILLGAALEAGLGVLAEAGFGDEARAIEERLTKKNEKARQVAFDRAFDGDGYVSVTGINRILIRLCAPHTENPQHRPRFEAAYRQRDQELPE